MPDIKRVTKRLEVHCDESLADLKSAQAKVAADRWLNQNEPNPYRWEWVTTYLSNDLSESWVVVYTQ